MTIPKLLAILAVLLLAATGLAACGDDDDSGDGGTTTAQEAPSSGSSEEPTGGQDEGADRPQGGGEGSEDASEPGSEGGESDAGEGSEAFKVPGGDNSIQEFGEEADEEEREAAAATLERFLEARNSEDWETTCELAAEEIRESLEKFAAASPQNKGKDCPELLSILLRPPGPNPEDEIISGVASVRIEGERAFALYHGKKGKDYFVALVKQDGEWRVASLAPTAFPGS